MARAVMCMRQSRYGGAWAAVSFKYKLREVRSAYVTSKFGSLYYIDCNGLFTRILHNGRFWKDRDRESLFLLRQYPVELPFKMPTAAGMTWVGLVPVS